MTSPNFLREIDFLRRAQIKHLIYLCIFVFGAAMRLAAVYINPITQPEALILLGVLNNSTEISTSPLLGVLVKVSFFLFGQNFHPVRIGSAIAGSLILLTPLLYEKYWGEKECLTLSFLLAIDPFLISNAIQFNGNSFALLFLLIAVILFIQDKIVFLVISLLIILLSGNYLVPILLIASAMTYLKFFPTNEDKNKSKESLIKKIEILNRQIHFQKYHFVTTILIVMIVLVLSNTEISSLIDTLIYNPDSKKTGGYLNLGLFFVALVSYYPFGMMGLIRAFLDDLFFIRKDRKKIIAAIVITFLFIVLRPEASILDLVWVTIPIAFLLSRQLVLDFHGVFKYGREVIIWLALLMTIVIDLLLILFKYVSPYSVYLNHYQAIWAVTIGIFTILLITVLISYHKNLGFAKDMLLVCTIWIFLTFQISIAWRSAGLGMNPEMEILWSGGYFSDHQEIRTTIKNTIGNKLGTIAKTNFIHLSETNPSLKWELGKFSKENDHSSTAYKNAPIIVTGFENTLEEPRGNFLGQAFVVEEKPLWVNTPIISMSTKDYWSWFFYRINSSNQKKNIIWVNTEYFPDFIGGGGSQ